MNTEGLTIYIGRDMDGFTFRLRPRSLELLKKQFPGLTPLPQVSIAYDVRSDFESINGPIYHNIQEMLTGLTDEQVDELGGISFVEPTTGKVIHQSAIEHAG